VLLLLLLKMLCGDMLLLPLLLLHVCSMPRPAILLCAGVLLLLLPVLPSCVILSLLLQLLLAMLMRLLLVLLLRLLNILSLPARCCRCLHLHRWLVLLWCSCSCSCSVTSRHQLTMQRVHHTTTTLWPSTTPSLWRNKQLHLLLLLLLLKLLLQLRYSLQGCEGATSARS
jgi:hypothetical protein